MRRAALRDTLAARVSWLLDGSIVVNLTDMCGTHLLEGYWPAVRFDRDDIVTEVTVEA